MSPPTNDDVEQQHPSGLTPVQGVMHSADEALEAERAAFVERAHRALDAVLQNVPFDSTADQMAASFLRQRLPPPASALHVEVGMLSPTLRARHLCNCVLMKRRCGPSHKRLMMSFHVYHKLCVNRAMAVSD